MDWRGQPVVLKLESLAPTGSFKDRGAAVLVTALRSLGITRVVEDSSGNAGASLAAYAAQVGITCEICVSDTAAAPKLAQIRSHGAEIIQINGKREYVALAAWAAAAHGAYYASHVYNPFFLAGTETMAYELWEQLGGRAPTAVVLPVGNGTLLLGTYRGFRRLQQAGLIERLPRIFAVQAAACAPIYQSYVEGRDSVTPIATTSTAATAISVSQPARGAQILAAVRDSGGAVLQVTEEEILESYGELARRGFYVEQTSAVAVAALPQLGEARSRPGDELVVVPLTAHGLNTGSGRGP
jgi:threonine synthase